MEKKSGSIKDLFGQSIVYGFGLFLKKALSFFLIPLYTHVFTHIQYGKLAMIYLFSGALTILFNLGLNEAFLKQFTDQKNDKKVVFSRFFLFRLVHSSLFLFLTCLLSYKLSSALLTSGDIILIQLASVTIWIECLSAPGFLILRITNRSKKYVFINTLRFLINIGLNILFILHFKMGIAGVLLGNLLGSSFIFFLFIYPEIHNLLTIKLNWGPLKRLLHYGLPLLPLYIIVWVGLDLIDRWLIKWILGLNKTGIYTLGYQFGAVMGILVHGFRASWTPFFFKNPDKKQLFTDSAIAFIHLSLILWGILSFFTPEIFRILVAKKYWEAQIIVPIIAFAYILFGLEEIFTAGFYIKSRTNLLIPIALTPLLVNISLNIFLIPRFGIMGAAVATLFSYLLFALFSYIIGNKIFPVKHNLKTISLDLCLAIILLYLTTLAGGIFYQRILAFIILCLALSYKEKTRIKRLYNRTLRSIKA